MLDFFGYAIAFLFLLLVFILLFLTIVVVVVLAVIAVRNIIVDCKELPDKEEDFFL